MRHVVIGTAGHIDHGKSALVQALTGIDPDRLKEEKARGITIDLGFAHAQVGDAMMAFVDVPGHERFVRNMLAGVTGIDAVMLVVAADESVMPQTREHFAICRLLGVRSGIVVLSKRDLADAEMLELAQLEVRDLVKGSFLQGAPVVPVSARTGEGLDALKLTLSRVASHADVRRTDGPMRLPIDRAFSVRGFGTVVTGTLVSGRLTVDQTVTLLPADTAVRVRGLQVHGATHDIAMAGQRVAVNLADVEVGDLGRGDVLVTPGAFTPTTRCDVVFDLLGEARPLAHGTRVRFHQGTREALGRVAISRTIEPRPLIPVSPPTATAATVEVRPGGRAYARVRLESPVVVTRGDRFVLRAYSPPMTIGGGVILDPVPPRSGIRTADGQARFAALDIEPGIAPGAPAPDMPASAASGDASRRATERLLSEADLAGLTVSSLVSRLGLTPREADLLAQTLVHERRAVRIHDLLLSVAAYESATTKLLALVAAHHRTQPDSEGLPREEARDRLGVAPRVFDHVLQALSADRRVIARDRLAMPSHKVRVPDADEALVARLEQAIKDGGLKPPEVPELATHTGLSPQIAERAVAMLLRQKKLVKLGSCVFHEDALQRLREDMQALKAQTPDGRAVVDVGTFKARYDISRKYAIPLLEYLDRERVTRRLGDQRIVL